MKNILKKIFLILFCGMILVSAAGCDKNESPSAPSEITVSGADAETLNFPASSCGVKLEKAVEKVVSLSPAATEIVCELGFKDSLVGISTYCDFPEGLPARKVGSAENPDIEAIIALKPDAVFTLSALSEREAYELKQAGIAVLIPQQPTNLEGYSALYREIASAYYGTKAAEGEKGETEAVRIGASVRSELEKAAKSVKLDDFVYVTEKLTAAGSDTFESAVLSLSGNNLCGSAGYSELSELGDTTPKYIIASDALEEQDLTNSSTLYSYISNGAEVKFVPAAYFERPSARTAKIFELLSSVEDEE